MPKRSDAQLRPEVDENDARCSQLVGNTREAARLIMSEDVIMFRPPRPERSAGFASRTA